MRPYPPIKLSAVALLAAALLAPAFGTFGALGAAQARDRVHIVGSSTVFPFSATVAEHFGRATKFKTPVVESTGTGGGLKLFCAGIGVRHPDIANASRRIKRSEIARCTQNGVVHITEIRIGFDGIVIANARAAPPMALTKRQIFLALAKNVPGAGGRLIANPNRRWRDIGGALPDTRITVLGPPPTSGTRDAFVELAMEGGCKTFPALKEMKKSNKRKYKAVCHGIREDGAFVEAGENDNLIVQKLLANPAAFGIFGFGILDRNTDRIRGANVGGVEPTFENIASGKYGVSRSLFFYVKNAHLGVVPGIGEYVRAFTNEAAWGAEGYLVEKGLIPLPDETRGKLRRAASKFIPLAM
jgi:phosphate transport system substrate-binding protein